MGNFLKDLNPTSVVGNVLDFGSQILGNMMSANQAKKDRAFQEKMYHQQVEDNIKFWQMNNEYNLPSAVMQRMRDANINPYLAFEGGASAFTSSQMPQAGTAPHGSTAAQSMNTNFGQGLRQAALLDSEIDVNKSIAEKNRADAGESGARTQNLNFDLAYKKDTREIEIAKLTSEYDLNKSLQAVNREQRIFISRQSEKALSEIRAVEQSIVNEKTLTEAKIKDINERLAGYNKQLSHVIANLDSQTRKNYADAYVANVTGNYLKRLYSDDYIKIMQGKAGQDLLNAIKFGTGQDIENALNAIQYEAMPKPGENMFEYNRYLKYGLNPLADLLKDAAIVGASAYAGFKMVGGKPVKVGGFKP